MPGYIIRGILIGILFGMPAGIMGAVTAQRTLNYGMKAGLVTGLGSSAADCFYAGVSVFGLNFISDVLLKYQKTVNLAGSCLILWMGIRLLQKKGKRLQNSLLQTGSVKMFLSSFAVGITNPASILTFLFAFSWFGISGHAAFTEGMGLVFGVFIGTYCWWGILAGAVTQLKKKAGSKCLLVMNRAFGMILIFFGTAVLIRNFLIQVRG